MDSHQASFGDSWRGLGASGRGLTGGEHWSVDANQVLNPSVTVHLRSALGRREDPKTLSSGQDVVLSQTTEPQSAHLRSH